MSDAVIRLTGRPKIARDPSGLRRITRTYIVQGSAVTEGNVEDQVFLPYGTPDLEYHETIKQDLSNGGLTNDEVTGAYLIEQNIDPGRSMNEATLTRVYQELDASNEPVQMGKDKVVRGAQDRLTVTRVFIVKNPYTDHYQPGRIGIDTLTIAGSTCYLGTVQSEQTQVYTQFTEVYFEDGILSESVQYKYGQYPEHKLEIRTLRSVADVPNPPSSEGPGTGPWFRTDSKEGPGNQDYGQLGKSVNTVVFAKGEGLISENSEVKGKPPNTVEVTTIKYITGENGVVPPSEIPSFTRRTFEGKDEKEGWELHTIRGVVVSTDSGVVDVKVQYKYGEKPDHKLEIASATSYGIEPDPQDVLDFVYPAGDTSNLGGYILIDERENTTGEFDVFSSTFARGNGVISETEKKVGFAIVTETISLHPPSPALSPTIGVGELTRKVEKLDGYQKLTVSTTTEDSGLVEDRTEEKYNGALFIKTLLQLGTAWDSTNTPAEYAEISVRKHRHDIYPAITKVFAKGTGLISTTKRKEGLAELITTIILYKDTDTVPTAIQTGELSRKVEERDGYKVLTVTTTDQEENLVDDRYEEYHNGALCIINRTALGDTWDTNNTPGGWYVEVASRTHTYKEFPAITKKFAKGRGTIKVAEREDALFTVQTYVVLGETTLPENAVNVSVDEEQGYQKTTYQLKVLNASRENIDTSYSSGLFSKTRSKLNHAYSQEFANGGTGTKWIDTENYIGTGKEIDTTFYKDVSLSFSRGVKRTTTTEIGESSANSFADGGAVAQIASDLFRNTQIEIEQATYTDINVSYSSGLKKVSETKIEDDPVTPDPDVGGLSEQLGNDIFRNVLITEALSDYHFKDVSNSKWYKLTTERIAQAAPHPPDVDLGGGSNQVADAVHVAQSVSIEKQDYTDVRLDVLNAGAVQRTQTTGVGTGLGSHDNSNINVHPKIGTVQTRTDYALGALSGEAVTLEGGVNKVTTTTSVTADGSMGGAFGSTNQVAPAIFIKKERDYELWDEIDDQTIRERFYYRLGVKFHEVIQYGQAPTVQGTEVEDQVEHTIVPSGAGSTTISKYKKTGATFVAATWTTYEVRPFTIPGIITRTRDGLFVTDPQPAKVWCAIDHTITQNPVSFSSAYVVPYATASFHVFFAGDDVQPYIRDWGGLNYLYYHATTTAKPVAGDVWQNNTVTSSDDSNTGATYANWNPIGDVIASSVDSIYFANGFQVFHQQEVKLNVKPI